MCITGKLVLEFIFEITGTLYFQNDAGKKLTKEKKFCVTVYNKENTLNMTIYWNSS